MADDTQTQTPADPTVENAALRGALAKVRADYDTLKSETQIVATAAEQAKSALGAALIERDTFKAQVGKLEPVAKEAETLRVQVQGFINTSREDALVAALAPKVSVDPLVIRSMLATFTEQGKANRYAEDTTAEAAKALALFTTEAPSLLTPRSAANASPGGTAALRTTPAQPVRVSRVG